MGTNFYAEGDATCNNPAHTPRLHVGKSSAGWKFSFRAYDDLGLTSWQAWRTYLTGRTITDEYGDTLTLEEFTDRVTNRRGPHGDTEPPWCRVTPSPRCIREGFGGMWRPPAGDPPDEFHDPEGFDFSRREFS